MIIKKRHRLTVCYQISSYNVPLSGHASLRATRTRGHKVTERGTSALSWLDKKWIMKHSAWLVREGWGFPCGRGFVSLCCPSCCISLCRVLRGIICGGRGSGDWQHLSLVSPQAPFPRGLSCYLLMPPGLQAFGLNVTWKGLGFHLLCNLSRTFPVQKLSRDVEHPNKHKHFSFGPGAIKLL